MLAGVPLRYKMTLFYAALTLLLLGVFLPVLYYGTYGVLLANQEDILRLTHAQIGSDVEMEDGTLTFENSVDLTQISGFFIRLADGSLVAQGGMPAWAETLPLAIDSLRRETREGEGWLILDGLAREDDVPMTVRAILSLSQVEKTMRTLRTTGLALVPALLLLAVTGGLVIAKRALRPIDQIISTTRVIAGGDLSERIEGIHTKDEVGKLAAMLNDMLEHVEKAFAKEKRFAADASHELRTPTSVIMAYTEALLRLPQEEETARSLQAIAAESRRMERMIRQLLMITRGDEKRYPLHPEPIALADVAEAVLEQMRPSAAEAGVALESALTEPFPLVADQSLVTQLLINLTENAIKYGKRGGHAGIAARSLADSVELVVWDDGIGMSGENLKHAFERFYRADGARDRSGSGLGLSIAEWIVRQHNGGIELASVPGEGTRVTVVLPVGRERG